jgi:hypothetical protein
VLDVTIVGKHGKVDDDKDNLLWRNKNGKPRSKAGWYVYSVRAIIGSLRPTQS